MKRIALLVAPLLVLFFVFFIVNRGIIVGQYRYLSFVNQSGIVVTTTAQAKVPSIFAAEMPITYEAKRASYFISLEVDPEKLDPNVSIGATLMDGTPLFVSGVKVSPCGIYQQSGFVKKLEMQWYRPWSDDQYKCSAQEIALKQSTLRFLIKKPDGSMAEELIPFEILDNGYRIQIDGL